MSQKSSPTYVFTTEDYDSSSPKFLTGGDFTRDMRFATKVIPLRLSTTKHSVITISIHPSDNVNYGCVSFAHPNGQQISSSDNKLGLYSISKSIATIVHVFMKDGKRGPTTYNIIVNSDQNDVSDILLINIGLGQTNFVSDVTSVSISYDCPVEVYSYNVGMHVYSPYDASHNPKLSTILYSFTEINQWANGTKVYSSLLFNNPALPYYYGYGNKVFKVGGLLDRAYGTTTYYRSVKKNYWADIQTTTITLGPRSFYDPITDTSPACIVPKMYDVGYIREIIIDKTTLKKPLNYRYYLGIDDNSRQESSYSVFTLYKFSKNAHYPITGSLHALIKLGAGLAEGYKLGNIDWYRIFSIQGMSGGLDNLGYFPAIGLGLAGASLLADGLLTLIFCTCSTTAAKSFMGMSVIPGIGWAIGLAILAISLIVVIVNLWKSTTQDSREECKTFLHRYSPTPYIEIGNKVLDRTNSVSPGLYYCDGIYYYSQGYDGTITSKTPCSGSFYNWTRDFEEPGPSIQQSSIIADTPTLVVFWENLTVLPYTSGKPEPTCYGTIYHNTLLEKEVPNKCCDLEIFKPTTVTILAKQEFSCVSQLDANNKAQILLDSSYDFAITNGNYSEAISDNYLGILDSEFTHSSSPETGRYFLVNNVYGSGVAIIDYPTSSEQTTLYFDNRDTLGLTVGKTVYFGPSGCQKAIKGFYTGAPRGGTVDGTPSTILSGQPIKTYQVENGKIKSITNTTVVDSSRPIFISNALYPTYISNWFLMDVSITPLGLSKISMDNSRTFDPLSLENNVKCYQGLIKKSAGKNDYLDIQDFLILSGGTYVPAPEGYYLPLIDWIHHSPFYYGSLRKIVLSISENCDNLTPRGFYIIGVDKKTNLNTPVFNEVILEVIVKSSNNKSKTYSATTSTTLNKTLIPYGTFFTSLDIINEIIISKIITESPLNNVLYTIGDTYLCPSVNTFSIPCGSSYIPDSTLGLGHYEISTDIGEQIGETSIQFTAGNTPDRFQIYWNNKLVADSLFVSDSLYGPNRQYYIDEIIKTKTLNRYILKNNQWAKYVTPIINVSYSLNDIASNGIRISQVSTPSPQIGVDKFYGTNISSGDIKLSFNKTTALPSTIRIVAVSPIGYFNWRINKLNCPNPYTNLPFRYKTESNGVTLSNSKFGVTFEDDLDCFRWPSSYDAGNLEYFFRKRETSLQIKSTTGGIPVQVELYSAGIGALGVLVSTVSLITVANQWVSGGVSYVNTGDSNRGLAYTYRINYYQPMTYEARAEIQIKNWEYIGLRPTSGSYDFSIRYTGSSTYYLTQGADAPISPVTEICSSPDVQIGRQYWTSCNLNVDTYRDNTPIRQVNSMDEWSGLTTGAWCYCNNDVKNGNTYGKLYNWYAMMGIHDEESKTNISKRKQIAPIGYHVPSIQEWDYLIMWVTGRWNDEFQYNPDLLDSARREAGARLKSKGHIENGDGLWCFCGYVDQTAGLSDDGYKFSALPGGMRSAPAPTDRGGYTVGSDGPIGRYGTWWTTSLSTQYIDSPLQKSLWVESIQANTRTSRRQDGRSIRLIRD